jgi:(1->4)-alpha-D-glucan 1-alpha-D-glucosylmutase
MARGDAEDSVIAFTRQWENQQLVAIAPRFITNRVAPGDYPVGDAWDDTTLELSNKERTWRDYISDRTFITSGEVSVSKVLENFPVALLVSDNPPE